VFRAVEAVYVRAVVPGHPETSLSQNAFLYINHRQVYVSTRRRYVEYVDHVSARPRLCTYARGKKEKGKKEKKKEKKEKRKKKKEKRKKKKEKGKKNPGVCNTRLSRSNRSPQIPLARPGVSSAA
jgi:hypothetical protein